MLGRLRLQRAIGCARRTLRNPNVASACDGAVFEGCTPPNFPSLPLLRQFSAQANARQPFRLQGVSYLSLALTLGTGAGLLWYYDQVREKKIAEIRGKQESVGVAAIGGPFDLLDQDGKRFTHENLLGNYSLLYFGFTHCPDICPEELEKLAAATDLIEKQSGRKVQPVFITVDPERDSAPKVKKYVKQFHPRLIGLTGPVDKVKDVAKAYRVYYSKTVDDPDDYLVDHSIIVYLLNPQGQFVAFYGKNTTAEELAEKVAKEVKTGK